MVVTHVLIATILIVVMPEAAALSCPGKGNKGAATPAPTGGRSRGRGNLRTASEFGTSWKELLERIVARRSVAQ